MAEFAKAKGIDPREIYTLKETQELLCVSRRTIFRFLNDGRLKYVKIPGSKKIEILGQWVLDAYADRNLGSK